MLQHRYHITCVEPTLVLIPVAGRLLWGQVRLCVGTGAAENATQQVPASVEITLKLQGSVDLSLLKLIRARQSSMHAGVCLCDVRGCAVRLKTKFILLISLVS